MREWEWGVGSGREGVGEKEWESGSGVCVFAIFCGCHCSLIGRCRVRLGRAPLHEYAVAYRAQWAYKHKVVRGIQRLWRRHAIRTR